MSKRDKIIEKASADMLISIHQNSFPSISERGAQAFFEETNDLSKALSASIQKQLKNNLSNARQTSNKGDYYILKNRDIPCSIVECGFLSNPDDEALLITEEYQQKVAYSIFCGVIQYLEDCESLLTSSEINQIK